MPGECPVHAAGRLKQRLKTLMHPALLVVDETGYLSVTGPAAARCHIVNIRGNSYRMRRHMELSKSIHPTASRAVDAENSKREEGS